MAAGETTDVALVPCVLLEWNPLLTKRLCHRTRAIRNCCACHASQRQLKFAASSILPLPLYRATCG